jgi:hypothetical protein
MLIEREGRHADRSDHPKLDVAMCGQPECLPFDEHAEGRPSGIGEQAGKGEHAEHDTVPIRRGAPASRCGGSPLLLAVRLG